MCGIVGTVLVHPGDVIPNLLRPLQNLEYRGYDSCGYFAGGDFRRNIGDVSGLIERAEHGSEPFVQGVAHTRWATHGEVVLKNAHPQMSNGRIYVVHNGVIDNYSSLKDTLASRGCRFGSSTDTEVIAHLIDQYVEKMSIAPGISYPMSTAVCMAMEDLRGKFSFIALDSSTETMVAVCNGRPLIVFRNHIGTFIASDIAAFQDMDDGEIYFMQDGEVIELNGNVQKARRVTLVNGMRVQKKITDDFSPYKPERAMRVLKDTTIMLAEIKQQPEAVAQTLVSCPVTEIISQLEHALFKHPSIRRVKLIGCGTSYHAAQMGARWLKMIGDVDASAHIASEFGNQQVIDCDTDLFVFLSQSGETADTLAAVDAVSQYAPRKMISVCNTDHSELVRRCQYNIATRAGNERSVASTKAFTAQLIALLKLAIAVGKLTNRGMGSMDFIINDLFQEMMTLSDQVSSTIDANLEVSTAIAKYFKTAPKQAIFLGRESMYPIALEGALKLAEIAYIPALTYFTGELKHGPLALVDKKTPVFCVFSSKEHNLEKAFSALKQVEARGGKIFLVTDKEGMEKAQKAGVDFVSCLLIPSLNRYETIFQPITAMIPLQLVAHEIAYFLGRNVDRPRNLAKSVTVE